MKQPYFKSLMDALAKNMAGIAQTVEEKAKSLNVWKSRQFGHKPTESHRSGLGGRGYTKADKEESKTRRKMAAKSRHINWGK